MYCQENKQWVVRFKKKEKNAKRLFNEYFAGLLCQDLNIPRPKVEIIELSDSVLCRLDSSLFDCSAKYGVATAFLPNICPVAPPVDYDLPSYEKINNKVHLQNIFGGDYNFGDFYGFRVFADWIFLEDKHKYENLFIDENNVPLFLDLDFVFMGPGFDELPDRYQFYQCLRSIPFCDGLITDINLIEFWLDKIAMLNRNKFDNILECLPEDWQIPDDYKERLMRLLFDNFHNFREELIYSFSC